MVKRFDVEFYNVETGTEDRQLYKLEYEVHRLLSTMQEGDDLVIHRVEGSAPGSIYPGDQVHNSNRGGI